MQLRFILFGLVLLVVVLYFSKSIRDEGFYAAAAAASMQPSSPSNESTQGPTIRDTEQVIQQQLVARDLYDMTELPAEQKEESYQDFHSSFSQ